MDNYGILEYQFPINNQKVYDPSTNMLYTYEQGQDSWVGEPATDELLAEAIEEKIDDSQLDACTRAVLEKLKKSTQNDIANMINHFNAGGSIFNINMSKGSVSDPNDLAQTKKTYGSNTDIDMVF